MYLECDVASKLTFSTLLQVGQVNKADFQLVPDNSMESTNSILTVDIVLLQCGHTPAMIALLIIILLVVHRILFL